MLGILIVLVVVVVGGWAVWKVSDSNADTNDIRKVLHAQALISERNECRDLIDSRFDEVVRERDAIGWSAIPQLIGIHIDEPAELRTTAAALDAANMKVLALPSVDDAVKHGYELDGVHYAACPKVPG
jgi:hypothetical protein